MDIDGILNGTGLGIGFVFMLIFGILYNILVERFQKRSQRYTAELVAGGVIVTVATSGIFIGASNMITVLVLFVGSGLPMMVGSWIRSMRDDEQAKEVAKESLK